VERPIATLPCGGRRQPAHERGLTKHGTAPGGEFGSRPCSGVKPEAIVRGGGTRRRSGPNARRRSSASRPESVREHVSMRRRSLPTPASPSSRGQDTTLSRKQRATSAPSTAHERERFLPHGHLGGRGLPSRLESHDTKIEHWDGASWTVVPSPDVSGDPTTLYSVSAASTHAWAGGWYRVLDGFHTLSERYTGRRNVSTRPGVMHHWTRHERRTRTWRFVGQHRNSSTPRAHAFKDVPLRRFLAAVIPIGPRFSACLCSWPQRRRTPAWQASHTCLVGATVGSTDG
jgi:hypothetical protein